MIIGLDLMLHICLKDYFKHKCLQWDGATVHMNNPSSFLGRYNLTKREMCKLVMQNSEPASTQEATEKMIQIISSTYAKAYLKQVADNAT